MPVNIFSHASLGNNPSRVRLDFRMLVRGKDGEPAGEEDIHCVGFFDHWMKKVSDNKRKGERLLIIHPRMMYYSMSDTDKLGQRKSECSYQD